MIHVSANAIAMIDTVWWTPYVHWLTRCLSRCHCDMCTLEQCTMKPRQGGKGFWLQCHYPSIDTRIRCWYMSKQRSGWAVVVYMLGKIFFEKEKEKVETWVYKCVTVLATRSEDGHVELDPVLHIGKIVIHRRSSANLIKVSPHSSFTGGEAWIWSFRNLLGWVTTTITRRSFTNWSATVTSYVVGTRPN